MKTTRKYLCILLSLCLALGVTVLPAFASSFTDAHGNVIELDDTLEAYAAVKLLGTDNAARTGETNLGDFWADALRWFAVSGTINGYFDEDDVAAGNGSLAVDADHVVALWNGGNLRDDIGEGKFGAEDLARVLPYPNKVAVIYMTGAQIAEALEAASYGIPCSAATVDACASFMQVSGLKYTVDASKAYDKGEAYGKHWFKANSVKRVSITEVNGRACEADALYAVITSNANFNGMDSSYVFKAAAEADNRSAITTAVVRDVIWMYLTKELGNQIGSSYAEPQGRITINGGSFLDVTAGDWFIEPVYAVAAKGLMSGTSEGVFSPKAPTSRAMMVTVLYRLAGSPDVEAPDSPWYAKACAWGVEQGITDGTNMEANITREQIAAMLYRYIKTKGGGFEGLWSFPLNFSDAADVSEWAYEPLCWLTMNNIVNGSNGKLNPKAEATRAEFAAMVARYIAE